MSEDGGHPAADANAPERGRLGMTRGHFLGVLLLGASVLVLTLLDSPLQRSRRTEVFDLYQRAVPRQRVNDGVVVIAVDDASLRAMGQWPWPRSKLAEVVDRIAAQKPAAIAIDALFSEPDRLSPQQQRALLTNAGFADAARSMGELPDYDREFAASIRAAPVALGVAAVDVDSGLSADVSNRTPIVQEGGDPAPFVPHFGGALRSIDVIDSAAAGHGLLNTDSADGVVRSIPTLARVGGGLLPSLPVDTLRLVAHEPALRVVSDADGVLKLVLGGRTIPTERDGQWWLHFSDPSERPHWSVAALLKGDIPPDVLTGRVVLLGYTALGLQDSVVTPRGRMAGVEVLAEAMDNAIDGRLLRRPRWARWLEVLILALLSLPLVVLVPRLRPLTAAGVFGVTVAAGLAVGILLFRQYALLIDLGNPIIGVTVVFAGMLIITLAETQSQRRRLREALNDSQMAQARLDGELDAARRIQMGMLPEPRQVLGAETRVDIGARMLPARSVGGDLYDFFKLEDHQLFVAVGDVSGKGLPASLFMALSKALTKGAALRCGDDPGRTLREAGATIAEENPELLFVTVLAAVLDLDSGRLAWCSAGHEAPWLLSAAGAAPHRLQGAGGPPLCVVDGFEYRSEIVWLQPGDALCLLTDGVSEAQNRRGEFYGAERIGRCLSGLPRIGAAQSLVDAVLDDTLHFAEGAEQADDLTILGLRWTGTQKS
ncbi:MAG: CHASE2 domain-containing protein [Nevskia sp.]|nr:CHASE2 domain-containing protein [Nevskia sp.]